MGKNDVNQIADNVRVVHAGCGVNALSGLQSRINSMYCSLLVGLISAAHQAILRLSSVSCHNLIDVVVGKLRPNRHWRHSLRW
ncbi:enterobactin synthetase component D [Escherichia coli]|uniref:Enterobactin synthetase component D n=1 Tax=Escherichia coli TaxID=562 RepID=A0A377B6I3_ECOLX|nr:enterobactin synthetase component D [Escherichia coli]